MNRAKRRDELLASYVARGFSGDKDQLVPLIKAAVQHKGAALIDVVSPCVAFNNHPGSTKSYDYVREHNEAVNRLDFMPERAPIVTTQAPGDTRDIVLHDGGILRLKKLDAGYDPHDKVAAMAYLESLLARGPFDAVVISATKGGFTTFSTHQRVRRLGGRRAADVFLRAATAFDARTRWGKGRGWPSRPTGSPTVR